jgi:hypothetical protein
MAEIEFLLPTVQYGNVKVRATPEELGIDGVQDAGALGVAAAAYLNLFQQGFKVGGQLDLEYAPGSPEAAAERLATNQKPRTVDEANEMARQVIENELGPTTPLSEGEAAHDAAYADSPNDGPEPAPWESTVDAKPKPWETGKAAPTNAVKVAEIDW